MPKCNHREKGEFCGIDCYIEFSKPPICEWKKEFNIYSEKYYYETDCSHMLPYAEYELNFIEFKYCPYCGKRIVEEGIKE